MSEPRLPNVGEYVRGTGVLIKIEQAPPSPPPPQPPPDYIFEDTSARWELRRKGETLTTFTTFSDFYGLGTSVTSAVEAAMKYAEEQAIDANSEVEVVVVRIVTYSRERPSNKENIYAPAFRYFESVVDSSRYNVPEEVEADVWSTKLGDIPATSEVTRG